MLATPDSAAAKLAQNNPANAVIELEAISGKATDLATAAKSKPEDATVINEAVSAAVKCEAANCWNRS